MAWKALYIILSLAVFFSTTGFTVGHHYCQNELAGTTIFGIAGGCHKSTHKACNERNHCSGKKESGKKSCCHNDSQYVKQDLPKQVHFTGIDFLKKPALIAAVFAVITLQISATDDILPTFQIYKPPIVCDDFQSLLQTFRL